MATAKETIEQVQQANSLDALAAIEADELKRDKPRATVLDAIAERDAQLAERLKATPAPAPTARFKTMKGGVVVGTRYYTKEQALADPAVMQRLVKAKARSLVGN